MFFLVVFRDVFFCSRDNKYREFMVRYYLEKLEILKYFVLKGMFFLNFFF